MVQVKTPSQMMLMREAGRVVAQALEAARREAEVGVKLSELDEVAAGVIKSAGARRRPRVGGQRGAARCPAG